MSRRLLPLLAAMLAPLPALAHPGHEAGLVAGFLHPLGGLDHLLAMGAVGLWAGLSGGAARLALPAGFLAALALGALLVPGAHWGVEAGILASVIVLGGLAALMARLPLGGALALVGVFGLLHGAAHGAELAGGAALFGMLLGSALLHGLGLALALPRARRVARAAGAAVAMAGVVLTIA